MDIPKIVKKLADGGEVEYKGMFEGKEYCYVPPSQELENAVIGLPIVISYDRDRNFASFVEPPECFDFI